MKIRMPSTGIISEDHRESLEIVAHDLRSPIHSISGLVELLKLELKGHPNENVMRCLELIEQNCNHSQELLTRVLEEIRVGQSLTSLNLENIDLVSMIQHLLELHQISARSKDINLTFSHAKEEVMANVDRTYLIHAIENLITNAIKFTEKDGKIDVILYEAQDKIQIKVTDSGIGISEEDIPFVFDKFTKIRRNGLRGEESTGLGMSITKQIVEAHQGEISLVSQVNEGTTFCITIPQNQANT